MRKICLIILIMFTVYSCKKENQKVDIKIKKENYNPTEYFSFPTNIKKWKNYKEITVNDSLKKVRGEFENYQIEGYINQYNQKINWWNIVNKKNIQADNVRLEYRIIDNKEHVNQYINYDTKNGDDTKNSLFYLKEKINNSKNTYKYSFYTPNEYPKKNLMRKFGYILFIDNKEIETLDLECLEEKDHFSVNINVPKSDQKIIVKGLFTELYEDKTKRPGQNEIYVIDTLKQ
ncbi:hypothetical protein [Chryseobacterium lathyri]|uniref:Lipoprotein n=1 Tax=Chryseobacterium lathyri TaxID=395933 RepID=A0ABT9SKU6_9FLAO|nr:hypothetical protein [Chryseobacterium lathyri]MDP9960047.1 hypothetical protein [Chryseobacterium lathyri]